MDPAQIATLLHPFLARPLPPHQLSQISIYIDLLLRWNARTNLTAIRAPEEIVTRHFGESLFAAQTLFPPQNHQKDDDGIFNDAKSEGGIFKGAILNSGLSTNEGKKNELVILSAAKDLLPARSPQPPAGAAPGRPSRAISDQVESRILDTIAGAPTFLDLGSGAGFPGIPIHLTTPNLQTTLLESQHKKVAFLREVIRALTLTNINVSPARAEDFPHPAGTVTLRAVERFDQILPTAARLVAPEGRLALLIAETQLPRAHSALPNFAWDPPIPIPDSASRILLVGARGESTPTEDGAVPKLI